MPTPTPSAIASGQGRFHSDIDFATMMPVNAATDPTDRSMWPMMMTITMPIARIRM